MAGRGPQTFKKRQKEQQRKEKQMEKIAKRLARKDEPESGESEFGEAVGNYLDDETDDELAVPEGEAHGVRGSGA